MKNKLTTNQKLIMQYLSSIARPVNITVIKSEMGIRRYYKLRNDLAYLYEIGFINLMRPDTENGKTAERWLLTAKGHQIEFRNFNAEFDDTTEKEREHIRKYKAKVNDDLKKVHSIFNPMMLWNNDHTQVEFKRQFIVKMM